MSSAALRSVLRVGLIAALILSVPLVAMQVTDEVVWSRFDFVVAGMLLVGTGLLLELAARTARNHSYRVAAVVAIAAAFLLVWLNLAVGIIGEPEEPANALYIGVLAVGVAGALLARFRPTGMARAAFATALAQALVAVVALLAGKAQSPVSSVSEIVALNGMFVALFIASAWLFRHAARRQRPWAHAAESSARRRRMIAGKPLSGRTRGDPMRQAFMSIEKGFTTYSEGMTRVAERAQPWDPGACRRR